MHIVRSGEGMPLELERAETWRLLSSWDERQANFVLPEAMPDADRNDLIISLPLAYEGVASVVMTGRPRRQAVGGEVISLDDARLARSETLRVIAGQRSDVTTVDFVRQKVEAAVAAAAKCSGAGFLEVLEPSTSRLLDLKKIFHWI